MKCKSISVSLLLATLLVHSVSVHSMDQAKIALTALAAGCLGAACGAWLMAPDANKIETMHVNISVLTAQKKELESDVAKLKSDSGKLNSKLALLEQRLDQSSKQMLEQFMKSEQFSLLKKALEGQMNYLNQENNSNFINLLQTIQRAAQKDNAVLKNEIGLLKQNWQAAEKDIGTLWASVFDPSHQSSDDESPAQDEDDLDLKAAQHKSAAQEDVRVKQLIDELNIDGLNVDDLKGLV